MTNLASRKVSNLCISGDLGLVETEGHSSRFIQVLDESMCVVREDLTDWLQRYLFSTVDAPPIDSAFLLLRLRSGLWLSRLAYKLQLSVLQTSSGAAPPNKPASKERDYNFLRGAVSNQNLRKVSKASLPPFPHTLEVCAGLPLGQPDVCSYSLSDTYPGDVTTSSSSAYSSSDSPEHYPQSHTESSKPVMRVADQWAARDNVSCFIQWCKDLGIPQTVLFETTGLVHRTEEKNVLLTLMELARIASRFGLTDLPELVRLEREIDALEEALSGRLEEEPSSLDPVPNPCTRTECVKKDQFVDEGIAEDHDEKADLFPFEPDSRLGSSDVDRTPKSPEPQPLTRVRSIEVNPAVPNHSSESTFTSFIAEEEEKREENSSDPVALAGLQQFVDSTVSDKLSENRAMKDGSAQTVGPSGDVWTAHDNEQHDTISSDISGISGITSGRSSDTFVENQVEKKLALCTCCNRLHIQRLEEGRYRVNGRIYYFRRFRNHVMVRIGGGWLTLDAFLSRHDPCRRGKCVPAAVPDSRTALSSSVSDLQRTDFDSKKSLLSMTTSVMALGRLSSAHMTSRDQIRPTRGGIAPTLDSEVNEVVKTESSKPLNSSHPNLLIGASPPEPKSTSRLPVPMHSSLRQSNISEGTGPTDNYGEIIPRAPRRSSVQQGSTSSAPRHSPELSRRKPSESLSSRLLSTPVVNRPDLRLSSHVANISQEIATKPNLPPAPTRIPVPRKSKSVSRVTGSTPNSGSSIPSLTHPLLPTKTYHDEHQ